MLITKDDAQKMDMILRYLVENETARFKLKQIMDLLNTSLECARYLYESILRFNNETEPVISIHHGGNIAQRPYITRNFLEKGGFMAIYEKQENIKARQESNETEFQPVTQSGAWKDKIFWITFFMAIMAFVMALISLLISLKLIKVWQ
jgi:hypothetical protein